jgi:universal stress protein E
MSNKQQILVILEPDNHPLDVVERTAWIAAQNDFDVTLLWCDPDVGPAGTHFLVSNEARDIGEEIRVMQNQIIEDLAKPLKDKGLSVGTQVLEERPIAEGVLQQVLDLKPAYLVKGTQYHDAAERAIFVDTDWHLMRSCPCPLWLVKTGKMPDKPRIVATVDPMHSHDKPAALDQVIVDNARRIAAATDGEVHLLHTYHWLQGVGAAANRTFKPIKIQVDEIEGRMRDEHQERLDALAAANGIDAAHTHQLPGAARELIPAFVRSEEADLVVMGALARWGLKRAVIGSTAERVLDQLPCDILLVRLAS